MGGTPSKTKTHNADESRKVRQEAVLWFGFVASLATLVTLVIAVTDLANRATASNDDLNEKLDVLLRHNGIEPHAQEEPSAAAAAAAVADPHNPHNNNIVESTNR